MKKIVHGSNLIMLIVIKTLLSIIRFKTKLLKHFYYFRFYWNSILAHDQTLVITNRLMLIEPFVFLDIVSCISFIRISIQYSLHEVFPLLRNKLRNLKFSSQDLLIEFGCVWIFKGQISAYHCI